MKDNKYNGWTNHETRSFNKWITNEEEDYNHALELAEDSESPYELSKKLKSWAEEIADDALCSYEYVHGFIEDVVNSCVKEINFYEVAEHLWDEYGEYAGAIVLRHDKRQIRERDRVYKRKKKEG